MLQGGREMPTRMVRVEDGIIQAMTSRGEIFLLDEYYEELLRYTWFVDKGYIVGDVGSGGKKQKVRFHRYVMELSIGRKLLGEEIIDHRNGERLDNRINNLRITTVQENSMNREKHKTNRSGYKGIFYNVRARKWQARIMYKGVSHHLGLWANEVDAAIAYDEMCRYLHGEFARTNFPQ